MAHCDQSLPIDQPLARKKATEAIDTISERIYVAFWCAGDTLHGLAIQIPCHPPGSALDISPH